MRKLTTTLCMTIAVLLGMTGSGISTDFENRVKTERQKIIAALSPISTKRHCPADEMWRETLLETRGYFFRTKLPPLYYRIGDTGNNDNTKPYCNTIVKINPKSCSTHPHNTYLQLLAETGFIGFLTIFFVFLFVSAT